MKDHGATTLVADRISSRNVLEAQTRALELLGTERDLADILADACLLVEERIEGARCAVMICDPDGKTLHLAAAPRLPARAVALLEQLDVGPDGGSPGAAIQRGEPVVSESIAEHRAWRDLAGSLADAGLEGCWSTPLAEDGDGSSPRRFLGTLDLYFDSERSPSSEEAETLRAAGELVRRAVLQSKMIGGLVRQTLFDSLTLLPNRTLFGDRLRELVERERRERSEYRFAVVAVDIEQLKNINDTLGYNMGDYLLRAVGQRLESCVRKDDTVARSAGDDFLLLLKDIHRDDDVAMIAEKVLTRINSPYDFDGQGLFVTSTLGVSVFPWDGEDAHTLLRNAETALHHAKDLGGSTYQLFRPTMVRNKPTFEDWWRRSKLSSDLRDAVEKDQFELYYQLKYDTAGHRIVGAEALIRWRHPELGLLLPGNFIPLAEQTGQIVPIGAWALETACRQNKQWQDSGLLRMPVAVNVTAHQFRHSKLGETITKVLQQTGLEPQYLDLEITESLAMEDGHRSLQRLQALHDLGLQLTIDDFGTGFSSLSYLNRFPIDTLKIDRSFIKDIGTATVGDTDSQSIVRAVLSIARSLELTVVAEGVETEEQRKFLEQNDCDQIQGFLFARPQDAASLTKKLIQRS